MVAVSDVATLVRIRPWLPGDDLLLAAIGDGLSPASLYTRFLTGTPSLPRGYLRYVANAPRSRWDAVVGLIGGSVVGWAEAARLSDGGPDAELAVVVVDAWQRRGIGATLARRLAQHSLAAGVTTLHAEVLAENLPSNRLVRSLAGPSLSVTREGSLMHYRLPLVEGLQVARRHPVLQSVGDRSA